MEVAVGDIDIAKFITSWGSFGNGDDQFDYPRGLSTDEFGNVYVADRDLHRMQKFTGTGEFITIWGSFGSGEGQFNLPYGIRASGDGFVYVSDSSNNRVQKFRVIPCPWDLNFDDTVGAADLLSLLAQWGTDPSGPPDFDEDGDVGASDLLALLANWGPCS